MKSDDDNMFKPCLEKQYYDSPQLFQEFLEL